MKLLIHFLLISFFQISSYAAISVGPVKVVGNSLLTGKSVSIAADENEKNGMVVVFLSSKCPCSNSHVPELKKLSEKFKDYNFVVVHSNVDEDKNLAKEYFKNVQLPFDVISDQNTKIADQFFALKTPHAFLLNRKGEILYQGGMTSSADAAEAKKHYLALALEEISMGKPVGVPTSRTLGCVISREE